MTNFPTHTNPKGTHVNREQKANRTSTPNTGLAAKLSNLYRVKGPSSTPTTQGPVRPQARRLPLAIFCALVLLTSLAFASSASAAPPSTTCCTISDVSYTTVHVTGTVTSDGSGSGFGDDATSFGFQYSTEPSDPTKWQIGFQTGFPTLLHGAFTDKPVEATIPANPPDLKPGTTYFVRLVAQNGVFFPDPANPEATSPLPHPSFTTLPVDPPTIPGAVEASSVFSTSAKAIGKVKRPANPANPGPGVDAAFDVNCHFDYITDAAYQDNITSIGPEAGFTGATPVDCTQNPIKQADAGIEKDVSADFVPGTLTPATTYHLRLVAENAGGTVTKDAATFTTAPKVAAPSVITVNDASEVKFNTATLTGKVLRPGGTDPDPALDVNCHFEYVTDAAFQPLSEQQNLTLTGATGGTFTLGFAGESTAPIAFDASAADVQAALESLSSIGAGNVSVSGSYEIDFAGALADKDVEQIFVDPSALEEAGVASAETTTPTEGHVGGFEAPTPADCEQNPITADKVDPDNEIEVTAKPGLIATTKYHFRLVAENEGGGDAKDAENTFTTPEADLPTVTIDPVDGGTEAGIYTTAHLSGTVTLADGHTSAGEAILQVSSDGGATWSSIGNAVGNSALLWTHGNTVRHSYVLNDGEGLYMVEADLTGLQPSTTYLYRIAASYGGLFVLNGGPGFPYYEARGEVGFSPEETITTEPATPPTAEDLAVTDVGATSAHFSGKVNPNAPAGPLSPLAKKAFETKWHFECTPECKDRFGNEIGGTVQGEEGAQPVAADLEGLDPNTEYEVRLVVSSAGGGEPAVKTFNTELIKPTVKAFPGGSDGNGGYVLQGTVNPNASPVTDCTFGWGPGAPALGGTKPTDYAFQADCSPKDPGAGAKALTVEAPLTSLNPGSHYQFRLFATNDAGEEKSEILEFIPELAKADPCANEQQRTESNSLALPECRAYELVTPMGKEGFSASLETYDGGDRLAYISGATNIAKSGQGRPTGNYYVAERTAAGWETIPNLNGSSGSLRDAPSNVDSAFLILQAYSHDLLSSVWALHRKGDPDIGGSDSNPIGFPHLRSPDGTFAPIGPMKQNELVVGAPIAASADLSHVVNLEITNLGLGVYEYVGTGTDQPRRVDLDNSGAPISTCAPQGSAKYNSISDDGSTIVNTVYGGCGADNPPAGELWARVNGTTAIDVSASHCNRAAADPGGLCNGPTEPGGCVEGLNASGQVVGIGCRTAKFAAATPDGSRVFFTTTQQLVNADTDQTNDIYACDLPAGNPAPSAEKANHCTAFRQVSAGDPTGAIVETVNATSENGAAVLFTAKGVLADNEDALKDKAVAGDHNLYAWRATDVNPDGETTFLGRLEKSDIGSAQSTPDGRYIVSTTATQLVDTDTDTARDVYRYDADTGDLARVSTNVFGVAGNGDAFDAAAPSQREPDIGNPARLVHPAVSNDGTKIVFTTTEALSPADGNAEPDVYLWTPSRVFLISTGSSGSATRSNQGDILNPKVAIDPLGQNIYFESAQQLTPADGDSSNDVYDARIGGGFSFAPPPICTGEKCQPDPEVRPETPKPKTEQPPADAGNVMPPKPCPKGKVRKKNGKCTKKPKKHSGKKHHGKKHKRAGSNGGGNK